MNATKWVKSFFVLFISSYTILIITNLLCDRYSIFKHDTNYYFEEPNQNFIKLDLLLDKTIQYDSLIFGSSRVGKINPNNIKNFNYYNMTYSEGLPREHYLNIKTLIEHNIKINNIVIGLDDFSYQVNPLHHINQPMRRIHYEASNDNRFSFYMYYLKLIPEFSSIRGKINCYLNNNNCSNYDFYKTGMPIVPLKKEEEIEQNIQMHNNNDIFNVPTKYKGNYLDDTINDIKNIISLCKNNNINLFSI